MDPIILTTARLTLRIPEAVDEPAIADACRDEGIQHFTTVPSPYTAADAHAFVAEHCPRGWRDGTDLVWAVHDAGALAGMIGVHHLAQGAGELGYWTAPDHRGRGVLREAGARVIDFAFSPRPDGLSLARLAWHACAGNAASAATARSLGFRYVGTDRRAELRHGQRFDRLSADLLADDDRSPVAWPPAVLPPR